MPKIELPLTKSSLRKLRDDLAFAYEGHDLLEQKRGILAAEIVSRLGEIRKVESAFLGALQELYAAYRNAAVDMGSQAVALKSCAEKKAWALELRWIPFMGLRLPAMTLSLPPFEPPGGMASTTASYDAAREKSRRALEALVEYAALARGILTLSRELKRVQRRVNALEKVFIPPREDARKYIADRIEEMERDEIFVKKLIRGRLPGKTGSSA